MRMVLCPPHTVLYLTVLHCVVHVRGRTPAHANTIPPSCTVMLTLCTTGNHLHGSKPLLVRNVHDCTDHNRLPKLTSTQHSVAPL